ncbi:hypothetical protein [Paenarthrobacter sp. NPDC089316]|uniref:hypothetical protein n=1 Tax=unclassified Paenarthrobacter TaxID=2634190 RepID=UPI00344025BE
MTATHLVVLGNADAARWVLANQRMAFSEVGKRTASRLSRGDRFLFYASFTCWPRLGGDQRPTSGLIIGDAVVLTEVRELRTPVLVGGRHFRYGCEVFFEHLAPVGTGVSIGSIRDELELTAGRANYGQALQRTPVLLSQADTERLAPRLEGVWKPYEETIAGYLQQSIL